MKREIKIFFILIAFLLCEKKKKNYHSHPRLSQSPWPIVHKNPAGQASSEFPGPSPELKVELFNYKGPGWILFDSKGHIIFGGFDVIRGVHQFKRLNPERMDVVASSTLSIKNLTSLLGGLYSFIDHEDCIWTSTDITLHRLCQKGALFEEDMKFDISELSPEGFSEEDTIIGMIPLYHPSEWMDIAFITMGINYRHEGKFLNPITAGATLGLIKIKNGTKAEVYYYRFEGEAVQNNIVLDRKDNIYVITNRKLYKMRFEDPSKEFKISWGYPYEPGPPVESIPCEENLPVVGCLLLNYLKKVRFFDGSGTTPTLMGDNEEYVGFGDGAYPMKVIVLRTEDGSSVDIPEPLPFPHDPGSQTENTFAYYEGRFIVENNNPLGSGVTCYEIKGDYGKEKVERIWVNEEVFAPNNVPLVSGGSGVAYVYELKEEKWFLTALDLNNGNILWRKFIGTGMDYNSMYAPLNLNDKKEIYIGLWGKILRVRE